jgi:hypothetical protein
VHFLVPVSAGLDGSNPPRAGSAPHKVDVSDRNAAEQRLAFEEDWARAAGFTASGELVFERDAVDAVQRLASATGADQIIVSTMPTAVSRWLRQDLPRRIQRKVDVPVNVVTPSSAS